MYEKFENMEDNIELYSWYCKLKNYKVQDLHVRGVQPIFSSLRTVFIIRPHLNSLKSGLCKRITMNGRTCLQMRQLGSRRVDIFS